MQSTRAPFLMRASIQAMGNRTSIHTSDSLRKSLMTFGSLMLPSGISARRWSSTAGEFGRNVVKESCSQRKNKTDTINISKCKWGKYKERCLINQKRNLLENQLISIYRKKRNKKTESYSAKKNSKTIHNKALEGRGEITNHTMMET